MRRARARVSDRWNAERGVKLVLFSIFVTHSAINSVPVAQWLEHCVSSAKVVGLIPREHTY